MGLFEKLASLFKRDDVPDEAKALLDNARTTADLLHGLDTLVTRNCMELDELNREIDKLERQERDEMERVRSGGVDGRAKQNVLRKIQRLRKQMDNYENRVRIFNRNVDLHQQLIAKIQEIEAMKLRGVDESRIDQIIMEHSEELERYHDTMSASRVADEVVGEAVTAREQQDLARLEAEIRGEEKEKEPAPKARERERPVASVVEDAGEVPKPETEKPRRRPIEDIADEAMEAEPEKPAPTAERRQKQAELE